MEYINATNFRNHIDRYLKQAGKGAGFIVTLFGKPVAYVGPWQRIRMEPPEEEPPTNSAMGMLKDVPTKKITLFDRHCKRRALFDAPE